MPHLQSDVGSRKSSSNTLFIVTSNGGEVDAATRKLIRSQAMRGRKQKRIGPNNVLHTFQTKPAEVPTKQDRVNFPDLFGLYAPPQLCCFGSDLCFVPFAEELELSMLLNIAKNHAEWLHTIRDDVAALHITAFTVEGFIDRILRQRKDGDINPLAMMHYDKGLTLLRQRFADGDDKALMTDATIGTVLKLAKVAIFCGEQQAARDHMDGVRRIVELRGGLPYFDGRYLQVEILRCDLSVALATGSAPVFFCQPSEPFVEYPLHQLPSFDDFLSSGYVTKRLLGIDSELKVAWSVLRRFCALINLASQTQRLIPLTLIYNTMASVMYRLLYMQYAAGSIDEAIRHGLLAYSYHIFLQWQDVKPPHERFCASYTASIESLKMETEVLPYELLWLSMVAAVSILDIQDEQKLREDLRWHAIVCKVTTWKDMRAMLKSFMWIDLLDDAAGHTIFKTLDLDKTKPTPI